MIEIIPAMDLIEGKCVRLMQGSFSQKTVYSDDPLETAKRFEAAGMKRLHIVDLDGARTGKIANINVLERVASGTALKIDFGGGVKTGSNVEAVFEAGAAMINVGSLAVKEPETFLAWIEKFGADKILLGADVKDGKIAIDGWQTGTDNLILDFIAYYATRGLTQAFVTDIASDGAMTGPATGLYELIIGTLPAIGLIASGGVRDIADIDELDRIGCSAVIIGKAIYESRINIEDLGRYAG